MKTIIANSAASAERDDQTFGVQQGCASACCFLFVSGRSSSRSFCDVNIAPGAVVSVRGGDRQCHSAPPIWRSDEYSRVQAPPAWSSSSRELAASHREDEGLRVDHEGLADHPENQFQRRNQRNAGRLMSAPGAKRRRCVRSRLGFTFFVHQSFRVRVPCGRGGVPLTWCGTLIALLPQVQTAGQRTRSRQGTPCQALTEATRV